MNKNLIINDFISNLKKFIILVFILLIEGLIHHYYYFISSSINFLEFRNQSGHNKLIWDENGFVEILQVIFLLFSIIFFFKYLKNSIQTTFKENKYIAYLYLISLLYYFFEEISWGQHIFGWETPDFFIEINSQNETNIHNTSSLLNELPRNLLFIWCAFSFLFTKYSKFLNYELKFFIFPNKNLKFISFLILFFFLPDFFVDKFDLTPGHPAQDKVDIILNTFFDILTFNFIRLSELLELLFNYYILSHAYYLSRKFSKI